MSEDMPTPEFSGDPKLKFISFVETHSVAVNSDKADGVKECTWQIVDDSQILPVGAITIGVTDEAKVFENEAHADGLLNHCVALEIAKDTFYIILSGQRFLVGSEVGPDMYGAEAESFAMHVVDKLTQFEEQGRIIKIAEGF